MELASMLAGEQFTDRPVSVCPLISALVRAYNDAVSDRRRRDLLRVAADAVGTRTRVGAPEDHRLQDERAALAVAWVHMRYSQRSRIAKLIVRRPDLDPSDSPNTIAFHVLRSLGRSCDASHAALLSLIDELVALTPDVADKPWSEAPINATSQAGRERRELRHHCLRPSYDAAVV
jgi:hypothetical protein